MFTHPTSQMVQWQDFKVKSEVDVVFEIAQQKGWKDCEIFGHGDMITQPLKSMGWKLIPADLYEYSIPAEGVEGYQTINAEVRIQGIIIADDERSSEPPPTPARPGISLPSASTVAAFIGKALLRLVMVIGVIALIALVGVMLVYAAVFLAPLILLAAISGPQVIGTDYDPKLIILVDDGKGETVWDLCANLVRSIGAYLLLASGWDVPSGLRNPQND